MLQVIGPDTRKIGVNWPPSPASYMVTVLSDFKGRKSSTTAAAAAATKTTFGGNWMTILRREIVGLLPLPLLHKWLALGERRVIFIFISRFFWREREATERKRSD